MYASLVITIIEVNPDDHHHFVCRRCDRVWDVYLDDVAYRVNVQQSGLSGFLFDRPEVQIHGLCPRFH